MSCNVYLILVQSPSHVWLCDPMDCCTPGFSVLHYVWVCSDSCPLSQWCHPTISSSVLPLFLTSIFPSIRVFSNDSVLHIRWPKCWNFSFRISPSNEYSGLISFRTGLISLQSRDSQESSPTPQFKSINSLVLSFLYSPTLTSIHDHWKNHSID